MKAKALVIALGILVAFVVVVGGCTALVGSSAYNGAITKQNDAITAWGQVQNVYQRQLELVPNLVATVKGAAGFERGTHEAVTEARARVGQTTIDPTKATPEQLAASVKAMGDFQTTLSRLLVVVENYPQLKATENFLVFQSQLEGAQNRIATERRRFNETVNDYNKHIQKFPTNVVLGIVASGKFKSMKVFEAEQEAQKAPKVDFSNPNPK